MFHQRKLLNWTIYLVSLLLLLDQSEQAPAPGFISGYFDELKNYTKTTAKNIESFIDHPVSTIKTGDKALHYILDNPKKSIQGYTNSTFHGDQGNKTNSTRIGSLFAKLAILGTPLGLISAPLKIVGTPATLTTIANAGGANLTLPNAANTTMNNRI